MLFTKEQRSGQVLYLVHTVKCYNID